MSMAGPLGVLPAGLIVFAIEVEDGVDGGPPGGRCQWVRQRPPPRLKTMSMTGPWGRCQQVQQRPPLSLKTTSMVAPLGGDVGGFGSIHHLG
jgi:hypothetical protein